MEQQASTSGSPSSTTAAMTENPPAPSEGLAVYAVNAYRSAQATSGTVSDANESPVYRELLSEARQLAAERASVSQDSFVSNPTLVGENRQGGQIWSSGSETFPVAFRRLEETDLSRMPFVNYAMATGSGRLSEAPPRSWSSDVVNIFKNPYRGPIDKFRDFVRTTGAYALDNAEEFDRQFGKVPGSNVQVALGFGTVTRSANMLRALGASSDSLALRLMAENTRLGRYQALDELISARGMADPRIELDRLVREGHAVGRHGSRVTELALDNRVMNKFDPITGTTTDYFSRMTHRVGRNATKFTSDEALLQAERYVRSSPEFLAAVNTLDAQTTGFAPVKNIPLQSVLGSNYNSQVFGKALGPQGTNPIDFTGGTLTSIFKRAPSGQWNLETMYPVPKK